ncbi:hypothetical protein [Qipengyuania profunda]|uniref:hypothetical protein n=1 Tax=Qipengyuania profunda TaxID=3113984 RepID=UPI002A18DE27|nr:hypothetical protein [Qipengyuania sp. HL-TH1]
MAANTRRAFDACLDGMGNAVTGKDSLLDTGALAEFIICFEGEPQLVTYVTAIRNRSLDWLRSGLLENILVNSSEYEYAISLLHSLATRADGYEQQDSATISRLIASGIIGRTELPLTWNAAVRAHFASTGVEVVSGRPTAREIANNLDKRTLRRKTDSYDLNALITVAQLARLGLMSAAEMPRRFAHILLLHAVHKGYLNWLPVAALLGLEYYGVPTATIRHARQRIRELVGDDVALLPGPPDAQKIDDRARISGQGVMIRSTLAHLCLLEKEVAA